MDLTRALRWLGVGIVLALIVGSVTLYAAATVTSDVPVSVAIDDVDQTAALDRGSIERRIHERVNEQRSTNDRDHLLADGELQALARYHSRQMHEQGFVGHEGPDGVSMTDRFERFGLRCPARGENVHYERIRTEFGVGGVGLRKQLTAAVIAAEVVDGWRESERHQENLLREEWSRQGIGVYLVDTGPFLEIYATQNFCGDAVSITVTGTRRSPSHVGHRRWLRPQ
jgi:uncharacterized protein YkwD